LALGLLRRDIYVMWNLKSLTSLRFSASELYSNCAL